MRTILLLGVAAGTLLLPGRAASAEPQLGYEAPAADTRVYTGYPDRIPSEVDYRRVEGPYIADGRWSGTWDGTYESPDGRRFDGTYEGSVEGRPGTSYAPPSHDSYYDGHDPREDDQMHRRCGRGGTVGGAVVGGLAGGVAGNRIAGHGDRAAGTLIGSGLGAIAGAAIGDGADKQKCEQWRTARSRHYQHGYYQGGHSGAATAYHHGSYGYGWYSPGIVVTTISYGAPVITETVETTTRTYFENVPVRKRYAAKKRSKPKAKPKPRCVC